MISIRGGPVDAATAKVFADAHFNTVMVKADRQTGQWVSLPQAQLLLKPGDGELLRAGGKVKTVARQGPQERTATDA